MTERLSEVASLTQGHVARSASAQSHQLCLERLLYPTMPSSWGLDSDPIEVASNHELAE